MFAFVRFPKVITFTGDLRSGWRIQWQNGSLRGLFFFFFSFGCALVAKHLNRLSYFFSMVLTVKKHNAGENKAERSG